MTKEKHQKTDSPPNYTNTTIAKHQKNIQQPPMKANQEQKRLTPSPCRKQEPLPLISPV